MSTAVPTPGMPSPAPAPAGAGGTPGQPPIGSSPMSLPTPNRGLQVASLSKVKSAMDLLIAALPGLGPETEPGKKLLKCIEDLGKMVPPGTTSQGIENSMAQQLALQQRQQAPMDGLMRQMQQQQGGGAAPPPAPPPAAE